MLRKFGVVLSMVLISVLCAVWSPWHYWNISLPKIFGVEAPVALARVQVSSLGGELQVYINGEERGIIGPESSPFTIEDAKPGQNTIRLTRSSEVEGAYVEYEQVIELYEEVETVIAYELGPTYNFSQGHVISAFRNAAIGDKTMLNVYSEPTGVAVKLGEERIGTTPLENIEVDRSSAQTLTLEKRGYEPQTISILPSEENQREKLKGFDINVDANMFLIPIELN
ncbi:MAG: PEGA domain-containing protein [Candidatus Dojkabacteria bacterium]